MENRLNFLIFCEIAAVYAVAKISLRKFISSFSAFYRWDFVPDMYFDKTLSCVVGNTDEMRTGKYLFAVTKAAASECPHGGERYPRGVYRSNCCDLSRFCFSSSIEKVL